ncbi:MAG: hypothetical protein U0264_12835 [Candidatus Kapaibacterium sp.]
MCIFPLQNYGIIELWERNFTPPVSMSVYSLRRTGRCPEGSREDTSERNMFLYRSLHTHITTLPLTGCTVPAGKSGVLPRKKAERFSLLFNILGKWLFQVRIKPYFCPLNSEFCVLIIP